MMKNFKKILQQKFMKLSFLESTNPLTNMKKIISVSYQHSLRQRHKTDLIHSQKLNNPTFNFN
jgi:hypothetical protein